jgi:alpha-glucosidase (family GH31 glycosyl hydrolase)
VAIIDLTLPAAVEWYKSLMRPVPEAGWMCSRPISGGHPGRCGVCQRHDRREMHNLYPLLYNQVVYK